MDYKLIITERAEELLDKLVYYLLYNIRNEQAAIIRFSFLNAEIFIFHIWDTGKLC
jgi:hypothetical protein